MKDRIRIVILILGVAVVWYIFVGQRVDTSVRRYPAPASDVEVNASAPTQPQESTPAND